MGTVYSISADVTANMYHTHVTSAHTLTYTHTNAHIYRAKVEKAVGTVNSISADVTATQEKIVDLERQRQALMAGCDAESKEGDKSLADQV